MRCAAVETGQRAGRGPDAARPARGRHRAGDQELPDQRAVRADRPIYTGKFDCEFTIYTNAPDPDNEGLWSGKFIPPHGANTTWLNDPVLTQTSHDALLTFDRAKRKALYQREAERVHELVPGRVPVLAEFVLGGQQRSARLGPASYISNYWNCWEWQL